MPNSVESLGNAVFRNCTELTSIGISTSVTSLGESTFYGCTNLASIDIPSSVTSVGNYVFYGCTNLVSINIPNSVTSIGNYAFASCAGLVSMLIPNSVTSIGTSAFLRCTDLASINISNSVTSIEGATFSGCTSLVSMDIPNSVTAIGEDVFYGCSSLKSINIPNTVTSIGNRAFYGCASLTAIELPNTMTHLGDYILRDCVSLISIVIPNSVTSIGRAALYGCTGLTSIVIPRSVATIETYFLKDCIGLTDIYSKRIIPAMADNGAFEGLGECTLHVPYKATGRYREVAEWSAFSNIVEDLPLISVTKSIEYAGNISGEGSYMPEDKAELTAVPNAGYAFSGWYEDGTLITNAETYTFTVTDNHDFTALFVPVKDENPVSITPSSGEVSFSFTPVDGAAKYTLEVYYDEDMTMLVASATEPVQHSSAKMLRVADTGTIGVGGLDSDSQYYYRITAFSVSGTVLSQYSGSFKTDISTGIGEASVNDGISVKECHDASGRKLSTQTKGLNIIRYSDGTIRKVMVK